MVARRPCITLLMIDIDQKNAILAAEAEFERRENLARALAVSGVVLIGKITSGPDVLSTCPSNRSRPADDNV